MYVGRLCVIRLRLHASSGAYDIDENIFKSGFLLSVFLSDCLIAGTT